MNVQQHQERRGIAEADLERILAPFEQAGKSTINVTNQGVGLGLAITQKLVELHGGTLKVESELGKGSTFFISLPLQEGEITVATPSTLGDRQTQTHTLVGDVDCAFAGLFKWSQNPL